jgi:hypothetical protein
MNRDQVEALADLAGQIPARLRQRYEQVERWREKLARLEGRRCTGRVAWRDKDVEGQTPKMLVLHSMEARCPVHGDPGPGGRLRVYVGAEQEAQEAALAAMRLEEEGRILERSIAQMERELDSCYWSLVHWYRDLGYKVEDGQLIDRMEG